MTSALRAITRAIAISTIVVQLLAHTCLSQISATTSKPVEKPPSLPITVQVKKTIAFLNTACLHDFGIELTPLINGAFLQMPMPQEVNAVQQLIMLTSKLQNVKQSMSKLSAGDIVRLRLARPLDMTNPATIAEEGVWRASILLKMTSLTDEDIRQLAPQDIGLLPIEEHMGTGFFVMLRDDRLAAPQAGPPQVGTPQAGFVYLVTNRHVAQPGSETGKPCKVVASTIMLNRRSDNNHPDVFAETTRLEKVARWMFPEDDSVDLAITPIGVPVEMYDYMVIGDDQFISDDDVKQKRVVEGDPVLFSGLFIQSFAEGHTLEPIVRSGTLAMIPNGLVTTTLANRRGHLYFAEAHAFGGNSGSPMFVDPGKFQGIIGTPNYKFLGVISGEVLENADLKLNVTTTLSGNVGANSDISTVVPANELLKLLKSKEAEAIRVDELRKSGKLPLTPK